MLHSDSIIIVYVFTEVFSSITVLKKMTLRKEMRVWKEVYFKTNKNAISQEWDIFMQCNRTAWFLEKHFADSKCLLTFDTVDKKVIKTIQTLHSPFICKNDINEWIQALNFLFFVCLTNSSSIFFQGEHFVNKRYCYFVWYQAFPLLHTNPLFSHNNVHLICSFFWTHYCEEVTLHWSAVVESYNTFFEIAFKTFKNMSYSGDDDINTPWVEFDSFCDFLKNSGDSYTYIYLPPLLTIYQHQYLLTTENRIHVAKLQKQLYESPLYSFQYWRHHSMSPVKDIVDLSILIKEILHHMLFLIKQIFENVKMFPITHAASEKKNDVPYGTEADDDLSRVRCDDEGAITSIELSSVETQNTFLKLPWGFASCESSNSVNEVHFKKNELFSLTPYFLYEWGHMFFSSNGLITHCCALQTPQINKINVSLHINKHKLDQVKKMLTTSYVVDKTKILLLKQFLHEVGNYTNNAVVFADQDRWLEFVTYVTKHGITNIYFSVYFDSRFRMYFYSAFAPASSRLFRFSFSLNTSSAIDDLSSEEINYFNPLYDLFSAQMEKFPYYHEWRMGEWSKKKKITYVLFWIIFANKLELPVYMNEPLLDVALENVICFWQKNFCTLATTYISPIQINVLKKGVRGTTLDPKKWIELFVFLNDFQQNITREFKPQSTLLGVDVAASVLQLMSIITACNANGKRILNITNNNYRVHDPYKYIISELKRKNEAYGLRIDELLINRKAIKQLIMTLSYGAKFRPSFERLKQTNIEFGAELTATRRRTFSVKQVEDLLLIFSLCYVFKKKPLDRNKQNEIIVNSTYAHIFAIVESRLKMQYDAEEIKRIHDELFHKNLVHSLFFKSLENWKIVKGELKRCRYIIRVNATYVCIAYHETPLRLRDRWDSAKRRISVDSSPLELVLDEVIEKPHLFLDRHVYTDFLQPLILAGSLTNVDTKLANNSDLPCSSVEWWNSQKWNKKATRANIQKEEWLILHRLINEKKIKVFPFSFSKKMMTKIDNGMKANIIHSADAEIVTYIILHSDMPLFTVHDAFFFNLNYLITMIILYRDAITFIKIHVGTQSFSLNELLYNNLYFK